MGTTTTTIIIIVCLHLGAGKPSN